MYSDLFDSIHHAAGNSNNGPTFLVDVKAGRMTLQPKEQEQENNTPVSFHCQPDPIRGRLRLQQKDTNNNNSNSTMELQWMDRRKETVEDTVVVNKNGGVFVAVQEQPQCLAWMSSAANSTSTTDANQHKMFWLQSADDSVETIVQTLNDALQKSSNNQSNNSNNNDQSVDALSSILENLGMPEGQQMTSGTTTTSSNNDNTTTTNTTQQPVLTLADLQSAMTNIASNPSIELSDVVQSSMDDLLCDDSITRTLMELLPPNQQDKDHLRDTLRSPAIAATLAELTTALSNDQLHNVLVNFQLPPPSTNNNNTANTNPVQVFLNAVLEHAKQEQQQQQPDDNDKEQEQEEDAMDHDDNDDQHEDEQKEQE